MLSVLRLKSRFPDLVEGKRGTERYADYPVYYRTNTLRQIRRVTGGFRSIEVLTCGPAGIVAFYSPRRLRPIVRAADRLAYRLHEQPINIMTRADR